MRTNPKKPRRSRPFAGAFLACLVGCGGGGGGGDAPATPTSQSGAATAADTVTLLFSATIQAQLRAIAAETIQTVPPRQWCASDSSL